MSERGEVQVPAETARNQTRAGDPALSIWVEANAGSGKTYVLTQRVVRLLLDGVPPQSILCLTYTKAAAAEMRKRVGARLAAWAVASQAELVAELVALTGRADAARLADRARTLFARALETPGGLRILTIHAFCEAVLHRFPLEAGVPFDFAVIEDDRRDGMVQAAREAVLAEGLRGGAHAEAVARLFTLMSDDALGKAINAALAEGARLKPVLADVAGAKARLRTLVNHAGATAAEIEAEMLGGTLLTPPALRDMVRRLGGDPAGTRLADALARLDLIGPSLAGLRKIFFTDKGEPRARLLLKAEQAAHPDLQALLLAEQERLIALGQDLTAALLVERSEAVLDVVAAIHARYEAEKRRHSLLDFDDLVEKLGDLLGDAGLGDWVRYKLDAGIDHILVDESQDTNALQWRVVVALAAEYFAGEGAVERPRSLFAVGDQKQSIYSFQGAQPALFGETGRSFAVQAQAAGRAFASVRLRTSFRTLPRLLEAVDRVCARPDIEAALLAGEPVLHEAARQHRGGRVVLWPPIAGQKQDRPQTWPLEPVDAEQSAQRQVALRIARAIRGWVDGGRLLPARRRAVLPDDVLILVQSRNVLFHEIIRALRSEGLPSPGADRLAVTGHIAVLDLMALVDVLLNPLDNLQLAALLRSPLFDIDEEGLYRLAQGRGEESLWTALRRADFPAAHEAAGRLERWRSSLDFERPYEFFAQVLGADAGRKRFHARLGTEVDEVLSEFLDLALAHEQSAQPSLQGFVADMRRRTVTIKRELAESGGGVRVMTVHGAKGLESPIVILADAASKPAPSQTGKPVYLVTGAPGPLLVQASRSDQHVPATLALKQQIDANLAQEYWRKLYVGMTRAEDELYVTGALGVDGTPEGSWYDAIASALEPDLAALGGDQGFVFPASAGQSDEVGETAPASPPSPLPLVLAPVPEAPRIPLVSPSRAGGLTSSGPVLESLAEQARDAEAARREGLALHALLQHLAHVPADDWAAVLPRALEALLPEAPDRHAGLAAKARSLLTRPELAHIFGQDSRAEVPFLVPAFRGGEAIRLSGRIDRLVVDDSGVMVVDYKSDATAAQRVADVPGNYRTQLGLYALVAGQLFPGRAVRAAILWTELESLMILPPALLSEAVADFTLR